MAGLVPAIDAAKGRAGSRKRPKTLGLFFNRAAE
jgi:hypothetical protein